MQMHKSLLITSWWLRSLVVICGLLLCTLSSNAADFTGKTIKIIVPFREGGGTDVWARFWAPLIAAELPGEPNVEIVNVPGGGGTKGANQFAEQAGTNGELVFASSASVMFNYLLEDRRVKFDYKDWRAIMASPTGGVVYVRKNVSQHGSETNPWNIFTQGPSQLGLILLLSMELLDQKFNAKFGAAGSKDTFKAMEEGFSDIDMQTTSAYVTNVTKLVDESKVEPLYTFGVIGRDGKTIERDPTFPELPTLIEYYAIQTEKEPKGKVYEAWRTFYLAGFPSQKMLVLPNNTDQEVVDAYYQALEKIMQNPDSWPDTKEDILGLYNQSVGDEANAILQEIIQTDRMNLDWYKNWVKEQFGISI